MKIDPKLKNRIRFNQLEPAARERLRRFHHFCSAEAALQILQSGCIWSNADDVSPNFTANRNAKEAFNQAGEVWLTFRFVGSAHLVAEDFPASEYVPNALYVHLYEWPDMYSLDGMRVALLRASAGTASGLELIGFNATPEYLEQCKWDLVSAMILTRIKRLASISRSIRVPANRTERANLRKAFPPPQFSTLDLYSMRWFLWRRRQVKLLRSLITRS